MQKRIPALLAAAALLLSCAACGKDNTREQPFSTQTTVAISEGEGDIAVPAPRPTETTEAAEATHDASTAPAPTQPVSTTAPAATTVGPLFQTMVRERVRTGTYTIKFKQSGMSMVTSVRGKDSVIESNAAGLLQFTLLNSGGRYYMLMPKTKKYVEMSSEEYAEQASSFSAASVELDDLVLKQSGTETLGGKKYETETYDEGERGTVTYYFDDTGLRKARVVKDGKTSTVDMFEVVAGVDASLFEIPTDYVRVADPGQLFAP